MLSAIVPHHDSWWQHLKFGWFDFALLALLAFGWWRGRKRGMTKELLPSLQWLCIMLGAGLGHVFLADLIHKQNLIVKIFGNKFNEHTACLLSAYLVIFFVLFVIFVSLKQKYNPKLEGSNVFGNNEYYWGVAAGVIRYASMVLVALALLNAPFYSAADIAASKAFQNRWFGGGMKDFSGDFIPTLYEVQDDVFKKSFLGTLIHDNLSIVLINSVPVAKKTGHA